MLGLGIRPSAENDHRCSSVQSRIPAMPLYSLFLIPLLAVMALRLIAMMSASLRRAVGAG